MTLLTNNKEWEKIEEHLNNQIRNQNVLEALEFFLTIGYEEDIINDKEIMLIDKWQSYVAVLLAINKQALTEERYEIMGLLRRAFEKQNSIMRRLFNEELNVTEETLWTVEFTKDYFYSALDNQVKGL